MKNVVKYFRPVGGRIPRGLIRMASLGLCLALGSSVAACTPGSASGTNGGSGSGKVADTVSADQPYFSAKKLDFYQVTENESVYVVSSQIVGDKIFVLLNATTYDESFYEDMDAKKMAEVNPEAFADEEIITDETSVDETVADESVAEESEADVNTEESAADKAASESVTDESVADETVIDETAPDETISEEEIMPQDFGYTTKYILMTYSTAGELISQTSFDNLITPDSNVISFLVGADGNFVLYIQTYDQKTYEPTVFETVVDSSGKVVKEPAKLDLGENFSPYSVIADDAGNRYFMDYGVDKGMLIVLDPNGKVLMNLADDNLGMGMYAMNGKVYTVGYDEKNNYAYTLFEIDLANKKIGAGEDISYMNDMGGGFITGPNGVYIDSGSGIEKADFEKKMSTEVLSWNDCEIEHQMYGGDQIIALSDTSFIVISSVYDESGMNSSITPYLLNKEASNPNAGKKIILVGGMGLSYDETLRKNIYDFNKNSAEYRITTKDYEVDIDYSKMETEEDYMNAYSEMLNKMNLEITSGDGPDVIYGSIADFSLYESKGLLVDLYSLMESDTSLKKDDFLPGILTACESNGKLYKLGSAFSIVALAGAKSVIGDRTGWTVEEFQQVVDSLPEKMEIMSTYQNTQSNILMNVLYSSMNTFVDTGTGKVNFDTDDFRALLKIAKDYGKDDDAIDDGSNYVDERELVRNGEVALMSGYVSNLYSYHDVVTTFGEPVSFVGYPSSGKTGPSCYMGSMVAISSESPSVDGAWSFVKTFFSEEAQDSIADSWQIPVLRSSLEKSITTALDPKNENNMYFGYEGQEATPMTEESAAGYRALVESVNVYATMDPAIMAIIQEEVAPYFNDQKSAEDVSKLIQNRVETIVKEKQ